MESCNDSVYAHQNTGSEGDTDIAATSIDVIYSKFNMMTAILIRELATVAFIKSTWQQ